jgi:hypothetical protein
MIVLAGCSNSDLKMITADKIAGFQPGKTNETEIVGQLGKPLETIMEADGTKIAQYAYRGDSGFLGGTFSSGPSNYGMVSFHYGANGLLTAINETGGAK